MFKAFCMVLLGTLLYTEAAFSQTPAALKFSGRIACSHDGNAHDIDDYGATAFTYGVVWAFGLQSKFVHMDYSDHLGDNLVEQDYQMQLSNQGGPRHFPGIDSTKVFDDQTQLAEAIANFKVQAEAGGPGDTLAFLCAGPMEVPYQCLAAVNTDKLQYIKCISHSSVNEKHKGPLMPHDWASMKADFPQVKYIHIKDQNIYLGRNSKWNFLDSMPTVCDLSPDAWTWMKARDQKFGDVSDVGLLWYCLTGNQAGKPADFELRFKNPICDQPVSTISFPNAERNSTTHAAIAGIQMGSAMYDMQGRHIGASTTATNGIRVVKSGNLQPAVRFNSLK